MHSPWLFAHAHLKERNSSPNLLQTLLLLCVVLHAADEVPVHRGPRQLCRETTSDISRNLAPRPRAAPSVTAAQDGAVALGDALRPEARLLGRGQAERGLLQLCGGHRVRAQQG